MLRGDAREATAANRQEMLPSATARTLVAMNVPVPLQFKDSAVALTETDDWSMSRVFERYK